MKPRLAVLSLARNCQPWVADYSGAVQRLADTFDVRAFVGEDGSTDGTREALDTAGDLVTTVDTSVMAREASRFERMARGRQLVADAARKTGPYDYVIVVDLDGPFLTSAMRSTGFDDAFKRLDEDAEIFAVGARSDPYFYDLLAYVDTEYDFTGLSAEISRRERHPIAYYRFFRDVVYRHQKLLTPTYRSHECFSSFNGLVAYRAADYFAGSYLDSEGVCEHVTFHRSLAQCTPANVMVVHHQLSVDMPAEHGPAPLSKFVAQRASKAGRKVKAKLTR